MSTNEPFEILLVEDDAATALEIQQSLSELGHVVTYTAKGEQALGAAQRRRPQLAIVATRLGGAVDGPETARRLADCGIPLLFLASSLREAKPLLDLKPLGGLVKPLREGEAEMVLSMAQSLLAERDRLREQSNALTQAVDNIPDGLFLLDREQRVMFANAAALKLTHNDGRSAAGQPLDDFFPLTRAENTALATSLATVSGGATAVVENISALLQSVDGSETPMTVGVAAAGGNGMSLRFLPKPASTAKTAAASDGQYVIDPVTDAGGQQPIRDKAVRAISLRLESGSSINHYAAVFVLSQFDNFRTRYGQTSAESLVDAYSAHLTKSMPSDRVYRWSSRTIALLLERGGALPDVRMELTSFTTRRVDYYLSANGRSALVTLAALWQLIPLNCDPEETHDTAEIAARIDNFEREHTRTS